MLIEKRVDTKATDRWERTALMWAIEYRQSTVIDTFIETGVEVDSKAKDSSTALHLAAFIGREKLVIQLLAKGANIEARSHDGFTSLHIAALMGHASVVKLLLLEGADAKTQTQWTGGAGENFRPGEEDEIDSDGWLDDQEEIYHREDCDNDKSGRFGPGEVYRRTPIFSKRLRQWILGKEIAIDIDPEARNGWTVHQLAISGENEAVQRLLEQCS